MQILYTEFTKYHRYYNSFDEVFNENHRGPRFFETRYYVPCMLEILRHGWNAQAQHIKFVFVNSSKKSHALNELLLSSVIKDVAAGYFTSSAASRQCCK